MENKCFTLVSTCYENIEDFIFILEETMIWERAERKGNLVPTFCAMKVSS